MLNRYRRYRTLALGVIATALLIGSAVWIFDVPAAEMLEFLIASVSVLAMVVVAALLAGYLLQRMKR